MAGNAGRLGTVLGGNPVLAFNVFGTKEIVVYIVVIIVLIAAGFYFGRNRSRY